MDKKFNFKEAMKNFWDRHKVTIVSGLMFFGGLFIGYAVKRTNDGIEDGGYDLGIVPSDPKAKEIDKDIYTRIAPFIEDTVLCEGLDEGYIDATYDVEYPKFGDERNGTYTATKKVEVNIKDVTE